MDNALVGQLNQAAIDGIRAVGATSQYIFVEGNSWTGAWHWVDSGTGAVMKDLKDPSDKIVYVCNPIFISLQILPDLPQAHCANRKVVNIGGASGNFIYSITLPDRSAKQKISILIVTVAELMQHAFRAVLARTGSRQ
jgi:hypothetical protein